MFSQNHHRHHPNHHLESSIATTVSPESHHQLPFTKLFAKQLRNLEQGYLQKPFPPNPFFEPRPIFLKKQYY